MKAPIVLFACFVTAVGCTERPTASAVTSDGTMASHANLSREEVIRLRSSLAKVEFPAPEFTVARLLPRPLEPQPLSFSDWTADHEKKGRVGGNIMEYRLDNDHVLQVATAYYANEDKHFSLEEWAVVLTNTERANYKRAIYPGSPKIKVPKE